MRILVLNGSPKGDRSDCMHLTRALLAAVGIGMAFFLVSYHWDRVDRVFDGSRVGNPDEYWLDFSSRRRASMSSHSLLTFCFH